MASDLLKQKLMAQPARPFPHYPVSGLHQSLLARLALLMVALVAATSAALFFGIDHFISRQFSDMREERLSRLAERVREAVDEERRKLHGIAQLLINDSDLRNSTYYYLYLAGEQVHPQTAVDRAAAAFNLERISLWESAGGPIAIHGETPLIGAPQQSGSRALRAGGVAWLVAQERLERDGVLLAWLQLAEPLAGLLERRFGSGGEVEVRLAGEGLAAKEVLRVPLDADGSISVDVQVPDTAGAALAEVKGLLTKVLAISGLVMVLVFVLFLRWQLRPLIALHRATEAVGRGDFSIRLAARGSREVSGLVIAFNRMAEGLRRSRDMEQRLRHEEQLSAIGRVAARVAHNINNPLTVIHNLARLLRRQAGTPQQQEDLETIIHQSRRAIHTVEQLLHYARPLHPRRERLALGVLCNDIAERWRARQAVRLKLAATADPWVEIDPLQFEELLVNLLDNAREAAPEGEIEVSIGIAGERAAVRVCDQGPGFPDAVRAHLFEPFFTTKAKGSGLGLASALAIARAHGGDLAIADSGVGEVTVWLPLADGGTGIQPLLVTASESQDETA